MNWLNYHHLLYFFTVAREGGVARAATRLGLSQSAVSAQLRTFQHNLGQTLLQRDGRGLALTEMGRVAYRYAEEIFSLGREFGDAMQGRPSGQIARLVVGVADVIPKLVAYELLSPARGDPRGRRAPKDEAQRTRLECIARRDGARASMCRALRRCWRLQGGSQHRRTAHGALGPRLRRRHVHHRHRKRLPRRGARRRSKTASFLKRRCASAQRR